VIIKWVVDIAPNKKFYELHKDKRCEKEINPYAV
jgi:hypothetical protein